MKKFIALCRQKRVNNEKAMEMVERLNSRKLRKCFFKIIKLNDFEREWLYNVRFELYFSDILMKQLDHLRLNVKYSKTRRTLDENRQYQFILQCQQLISRSQEKVTKLKTRFGRRVQRQIFRQLKLNVLEQRRKKQNGLIVAQFRRYKLMQFGFSVIADLKRFNDEVRNDKILSKALSNNHEFFQVQIRKENRFQNDQD